MLEREFFNILDRKTPLITLEKHPFDVIISPFGGRILQVILNKEENFLWTNNNYSSVNFSNWNIGGIRTWFSPERDYFYKKPESFKQWFCPNSIDPLNYKVVSLNKNEVTLQSNIKLENLRFNKKMEGTFTKKIAILQNTLANKRKIKCVISQNSHLEIYDNFMQTSIWTLIQVKADKYSGKVLIPINEQSEPLHYFGPISKQYLSVKNKKIECKIDGKYEYKLGVQPELVENKESQFLSYYFGKNNKNYKIEVTSFTSPTIQNECTDFSRSNPEGLRSGLQIYNSDVKKSGLQYGELEFHSKPLIKNNGNVSTKEKIIFSFSKIL